MIEAYALAAVLHKHQPKLTTNQNSPGLPPTQGNNNALSQQASNKEGRQTRAARRAKGSRTAVSTKAGAKEG